MSSVRLNRQAADIAARMRADMTSTLRQHGVEADEGLLDMLVDDGMFIVEQMIVENDTLHGALADQNPGLGWPR